MGAASSRAPTTSARRVGEVSTDAVALRPTGVGELDRVLGGGLVPGAVVLLAGEPGVGKSTLLLDVAASVARSGRRTLVVSGEESAEQVRLRAERTGALADELWLAAETDLAAVVAHVDAVAPDLLVVDSVQTVSSAEAEGVAGGPTQVRAVAASLIGLAKRRGLPVVLVGHVTKDGAVAGPRLLEHLVDVVLQFEGDRHGALRVVRSVKNRYGPADEVGCFEMVGDGLVGLPDPSGLFLGQRDAPVPGVCATVTVDGRRPLPAEVQALVAPSPLATPRRATSGVDGGRLAMVLAVLERRAGLRLASRDVYVSTTGGARVTEPAADLAVALALAGADTDSPAPAGLVALGEVGLAGDVRRVGATARRLAEARRLGFDRALVPRGAAADAPAGLRVVEVSTVADAVEKLRRLVATR